MTHIGYLMSDSADWADGIEAARMIEARRDMYHVEYIGRMIERSM